MPTIPQPFVVGTAHPTKSQTVEVERVATNTKVQQMSKIKIGQIGTAHGHASGKLEVYRKSSDYEVVGIVEPDEKLRRAAEKQPTFQGLPWLTVEQLLNVPGLQAVAVETEPRHLLAHAETCVDAGIHVHLDKPAGESLMQFRRILDTATRKHLCLQMGYMFRYHPAVVLMKDLVRKGFLGEPFEAHTVMSKVVDPANRLKHGEYSGGMMFELGCHVIDLVVGVLGKPERVSAFPRKSGPVDDGLVDNMLAVFEYPRATASVRATGLEVEGGSRRHLSVVGTGGTFHIQPLDNPTAIISLAKPCGAYKAGTQTVTFPKYERYLGDAADMARNIRKEAVTEFTAEHDLAVQETVLRASGLPVLESSL